MKIKLLLVGKTDESYLIEGIEKYQKRLKHYINLDIIIINDIKQAGKLSAEKLKEEEGKLFMQKIEDNDFVVLLDDKGKEYTSGEFAGFLQKKMNMGISNLIFIVGGAFGFSPEINKRANDKLSLSRLTFSHQMVRLFFVEQLYRGFTIIKGEKYHHE